MHRCLALIGLMSLFVGSLTALAEEKAADATPAVTPLDGLAVKDAAFGASSSRKPIVIKTRDDAATYFEKEELDKLDKQIDFKKQVLLVFAWKGSGQDKLSVGVGESKPETLMFSYKRGLTRDLRPHVKIFAAREDVKYNFPEADKPK